MRRELEFHDSRIVSVALDGRAIRIALDAYVHHWDKSAGAWKGEGWRQPVLLSLTGELKPSQAAVAGAALETGEVQAGAVAHTHLIPLPLRATGPASVRLETMEGEVLDFAGRDLTIEATGEGTFVEKLPDAFKPVG
ncbi:MAG TPA: hypothetical protein VN915_01390 [Elusimicrobiota bacterium]|nr:hypothetical protein [Elusimicrobiota bacterium]